MNRRRRKLKRLDTDGSLTVAKVTGEPGGFTEGGGVGLGCTAGEKHVVEGRRGVETEQKTKTGDCYSGWYQHV